MDDEAEGARAASARRYALQGDLALRLEKVLALIARAMAFPGVRIAVIDDSTQRTVGVVGLAPSHELPRSSAICDEVVRTGRPLRIPDAVADPRFRALPEVQSGLTGSFLGVPLHGRESHVIGAVCVTDTRARPLDDDQVGRLRDFAVVLQRVLEVQRRADEQNPDRGPAPAPGGRAGRTGAVGGSLGVDAPSRLRAAIDRRQVTAWYKPVIDLRTDRLHALELTPRWMPPGRSVDDARWLVPAARDTPLLVDLDLAAMTIGLRDLTRWLRRRPQLHLVAPLSAAVLADPDAPARLAGLTDGTGVPRHQVDLLLTGSARWSPTSTRAIDSARALRDLGFGLHLQDYGTGWTALDQLLWLPADAVKIDAALTAALGTPVGDALAGGVIGLAAAMGQRAVVGGVRSRAVAEVAADLGARDGLGELWSPALPADRVDALIDAPSETSFGTGPGAPGGDGSGAPPTGSD